MEFDNCFELHSCSKDPPMSLVMDDHGSQPHPRSSAVRVSTKSKAPSPPGLKKLDSPGLNQWFPGNPRLTMDQKENLVDQDLSLVVVLPDGVEKTTTVHGSKPLMDLLVTLCAKYHLNPSSYTLELVTANRNSIKLKPNALIGTLSAEKIILKPKGEDKSKKSGPQMPEATVRMVINYKKTQKTILRVNPRVPLAELLPAICEKCEFDAETTVLLRDVQSLAALDLTGSLNDYAIREVYARDTRGQTASPVCPSSPVSPTHAGSFVPGKDKDQKEKENKGLFSMFKKSKKKPEQAGLASSAPASPVLVGRPRPLSMALPLGLVPASPTDPPKKRRAPQPPVLVSQQSCPSGLRLDPEPDGDQASGLSRGSSAESSLKRTKRKAPPPPMSPTSPLSPTSPNPVNQDPDPPSLDEDVQGSGVAAANTLEEIVEQEEASTCTMSATASDSQGEDSSLSLSLHSPSPDAEEEDVGEDQSCDLSSDGNLLQSTEADAAAPCDARTTAGTDSSEPAETSNGPCEVEDETQRPICEESTAEEVEVDCTTVPDDLPAPPSPSPPPPVTQDAIESQVQANTETLPDEVGPAGEDAQVQTDFPPPPEPPQQPKELASSSADPSGPESPEKRDMATLTEELDPGDLRPASPNAVETSSRQDLAPRVPAVMKLPNFHAAESEPKPKPSNEVTRNYIPKVGLTTYTIVPQKSLEKLRYFEVALTLESPGAVSEQVPDTGTEEDPVATRDWTDEVSKDSETTPTGTTTTQGTANGDLPEPEGLPEPEDKTLPQEKSTGIPDADDKLPSPPPQTNGESQASSPLDVREKIPPATKPKPGSFRLAKHKKTPGHYVTSAAEKSLVTSPTEVQDITERSQLPLPPPPSPPPPVTAAEESPEVIKESEKNAAVTRLTRQSSEGRPGLSLEKLRSFAAPRPYSPSTPSRFAQAVSSAVKRSQSLSYGPKSPPTPTPFSPLLSRPPGTESKGLFMFKEDEIRESDSDKVSRSEAESPSLSEAAEIEP